MQQDNALRTFCRRLEILNFLKASHQLQPVSRIVEHLEDLGLLDPSATAEKNPEHTHFRKVQRDLKFLSANTPPADEDEQGEDNEFGLYFEAGDRHSFLWGVDQTINTDFSWTLMPDHMAVTLALAEKHLSSIMPSRYHQLLKSHYQTARQKLSGASKKYQPKQLENLVNSVVIDQRGLRLEAASVDEQILDTIYEALTLNRRLKLRYRGKTVVVHPHGVVIARPKIYLIAMKDGDNDIHQMRSYLVHRIAEINLVNLSVHTLPGFNLQQYVAEGAMEMKIENDESSYELVLQLTPPIGSNLIQDLRETPIAANQNLSQSSEEVYFLTAKVHRTYQLLNWILSLGKFATVLEPATIRSDIIHLTKEISNNYR